RLHVWSSASYNHGRYVVLGTPGEFDALLVTESLFDRITEYTTKNRLTTSTYNHGRGVSRQYTLNYRLQHNYHQTPQKYYVKRRGRQPPDLWFIDRVPKGLNIFDAFDWAERPENRKAVIAELQAITPSYASLCGNILRKSAEEV